jgi:hypothetical protein
MYLYIHSPIRLHGIELISFSTGTTLWVFKNGILKRALAFFLSGTNMEIEKKMRAVEVSGAA